MPIEPPATMHPASPAGKSAGQAMPAPRADGPMAAAGLAVLLTLTVVLGLRGMALLGTHNHYLELCFILVLVGGPISWSIKRLRGGWRSRVSLFSALSLASAVFVLLRPLPLTTIELELREAPVSAELLLGWPTDQGAGEHVIATVTRGATPARAVFLLPRPVRERRPEFTLHFPGIAGAWHISQLSYGTDFLLRHVPLAQYRGDEMRRVIEGADSLNRLEFEGPLVRLVNTAGADASLSVLRDGDVIRSDVPPAQLTLVKCAWLAVYALLAAAVTWPAPLVRRSRGMTFRLRRFLNT